MGRLDLPDVYRDEDYTSSADNHEGSSVDSPLNGAERQGTRSSSGATEEPTNG